MIIWCSILKTNVTDRDQNIESKMSTQNEDIYYMDSTLVKDKDKTRSSEATEETKESKKKVQKNQNQHINFKENVKDHDIGSILILSGLKIIL